MTTDSIPQTRSLPLDPRYHKRYWLFHWITDLARGGILDFVDSFDTIGLAQNAMLAHAKDYKGELNCWQQGHIWDSLEDYTPTVLVDGRWEYNN